MAVLLWVLFTGCGGGGESGNDVSESPPPADIQTSVSAPLYPADSSELMFFNFVNSVRQQIGLGLLALNAQLDQAVTNHARYLDSGGGSEEIESGLENSQKTHFTGVTSQDRCNHTGYRGECPQEAAWSEVAFFKGLRLIWV